MWISILNDSAYAAILPSFVRRAPSIVLAIPFMLSLSSLRNLRKHYAYTVDTVRRRLSRPPSASADRDLFAPVLEQGSGIGNDEKHLVALAQAMIIAGADTATNVMTTALYFLCATPGCMEKAAAEVRALRYDQLNGDELSKLKYLNAVIEEASKYTRVLSSIAVFRSFPILSSGKTIVSE